MSPQELRELDAWIAEHLFGWDLSRDGWCKSALEFAKPDEYYGYPPDSIQWKTCALPHPVCRYTTNPDDAMEVFRKIHDKIDCEDVVIGRCDGMAMWAGVDWYAYSLFRENPTEKQRIVNAETLELAICLFAKNLFQS